MPRGKIPYHKSLLPQPVTSPSLFCLQEGWSRELNFSELAATHYQDVYAELVTTLLAEHWYPSFTKREIRTTSWGRTYPPEKIKIKCERLHHQLLIKLIYTESLVTDVSITEGVLEEHFPLLIDTKAKGGRTLNAGISGTPGFVFQCHQRLWELAILAAGDIVETIPV